MKVQFEILAVEVEKLYGKTFDEDNANGINEHCEYIMEFIKAAGWDTDDYMRRSFNAYDPSVS